MHERICKRYACDFCKKSGCSRFHMLRHERGCTKNPSRTCKMCAMVEHEQRPISELIAAIIQPPGELAADISRLRELCHNCPACILAALRQHHDANSDFKFKDE